MANNTEQLRKDVEHTILAWSSKVSGEQRTELSPEASELVDLFIDLHEAEATRREQALLDELDKRAFYIGTPDGSNGKYVIGVEEIAELKRQAEGGEQS